MFYRFTLSVLILISDANREAVLVSGGCPYLIAQLTRCSDVSTADSQSVRVKRVTCGCVLNLANDNGNIVFYIQWL